MRGHSTPMGVFSVIQKHKFHHSNIYSNAPMPYMQRITWSGVAMHAGVLPGYPASHGCIRMPMAFAVKMWNWTRMGARVVVTPGELTPATFAHALLPTQKVAPQPVAAVEPDADTPVGAKASRGTIEAKSTKSETAKSENTNSEFTKSESAKSESANTKAAVSAVASVGADLALRTSFGRDDSVKNGTTAPRRLTADASGDTQVRQVTMSDASSGVTVPQDDEGASAPVSMASNSIDAKRTTIAIAKTDDTTAAASTHQDAPVSESKPGATPSDIVTETGRAQTPAAPQASARPDETQIDANKPVNTPIKPETKPEAARIEPAKAADDSANVTGKDQARPTDAGQGTAEEVGKETTKETTKDAAVKTAPPKRAGRIAVFISRKDSKLYVRQNFAPLFEVPITIVPSDRPLGTHIFTADVDRTDANALNWSVVTLPVSARSAVRAGEDRSSRRRKASAAVEAKPLPVADTPAEALDRIGIPADAMARVSEALTSGGSIIVSDQGINQGETGEGTDFIVKLR